jgi:hypothetical protein
MVATRVAVSLDLVLVIGDVSVGLHIGAVFDVNGKAISDPDQRLVAGRICVSSAFDDDSRRSPGRRVANSVASSAAFQR